MEESIKSFFKGISKDIPSALRFVVINRDGDLVYSGIDERYLPKVVDIAKRHLDLPEGEYVIERLDEYTLLIMGLSPTLLISFFTTLDPPLTLRFGRNAIKVIKRGLDDLNRSFMEKLEYEVDDKTKEKYRAVYEVAPQYKDVNEVIRHARFLGGRAITVLMNLQERMPVWKLTKMLQKAGISISFDEVQGILEDLRRRGFLTLKE
ncbi:MAG: hypothetical protein ACTSXJ_01160 [Candidatus Baldrarchaeia archaeon]